MFKITAISELHELVAGPAEAAEGPAQWGKAREQFCAVA